MEDASAQEKLCDLVVKNGLSVRQLEARLKELLAAGQKTPVVAEPLPDEYGRVLERIGKFFDKEISLKRTSSGKGTMTIRFDSDDEMRRFLKALEDSNI